MDRHPSYAGAIPAECASFRVDISKLTLWQEDDG
jgi:hypothetical protein